MALLQLTFIPVGTDSVSVGDYVAAVQRQLEKEDVRFQLNDMGTLLEGEAVDLLKIVSKLYAIPFDNGAIRVVTHISIDDRRDKDVSIGDKVETVKKRLNHH